MIDFKANRAKLLKELPYGSTVLFPAATLKKRNNDIEYPFRQDSNFYYLTGLDEPDSVLALMKDEDGETKEVLFVLPKDPKQEIWTGIRLGAQKAVYHLDFDKAYALDQLDTELPKLLVGQTHIYAPMTDTKFFKRILAWREKADDLTYEEAIKDLELGKREDVPSSYVDVVPILQRMRLIKTWDEIKLIEKACETSAKAHVKLMQKCRPGILESELEAKFNSFNRKHGSESFAYQSVVGSGKNGCILHYMSNHSELKEGDLVLVDAGGEHQKYASDITRTYPVSGKFSKEQLALYQIVLEAQEAGIEAAKPGNTYWDVHITVLKELVSGLVDIGLLDGEVDELIKSKAYKEFYPHSFGHYVGLDVHDPNPKFTQDGWEEFEEGMVFTVEPGIYVQPDNKDVDKKWRGIGIRIEDVIAITVNGNRVLSRAVPKYAHEIEAMMAKAKVLREELKPQLKEIKSGFLKAYEKTLNEHHALRFSSEEEVKVENSSVRPAL